MAVSKSPLASSLPVILPLALLGGGIGYLIESGTIKLGPVAAALAVGFGLLGAFLALQAQILRRLNASVEKQETVQSDLGRQVADAVTSAQGGFAEKILAAEQSISAASAAMEKIAPQLNQAYADGADKLGTVLKAHTASMTQMGSGWADQINSVFVQHQKMVQSAVDALNAAGEEWRVKLVTGLKDEFNRVESAIKTAGASSEAFIKTAGASGEAFSTRLVSGLQEQVAATTSSNRALTDAISRLALLGQDIEKLLHVQQSVDTALETISKTEEFKRTITRLSEHLVESDRLLRELAKPKKISLVEETLD